MAPYWTEVVTRSVKLQQNDHESQYIVFQPHGHHYKTLGYCSSQSLLCVVKVHMKIAVVQILRVRSSDHLWVTYSSYCLIQGT